MLRLRIVSAVIVGTAMVGALWADLHYESGWGLAAAMAVFTFMGLREFYRMARGRGWQPFSWFGMILGPALVFGHERWCLEKWHSLERLHPDVMTTLVAATVIGCFLVPVVRRQPLGAMANIGTTLLGLLYVWFLPSFLPRMRHLSLSGSDGWVSDGVEFVVFCIVGAKAADVGGYLVGSRLGRHKLCPQLSPKKTWEGVAGGVAASVAVVSLIAARTHGAIAGLGWPKVIMLAVVLALSSLLGDLVESAFKRDSEMKDAGTSIPGFGGVLDLVDSLMISAPAMYYYLILVGGARAGAG